MRREVLIDGHKSALIPAPLRVEIGPVPAKSQRRRVESVPSAKAHTTYRLADGTIVPSVHTALDELAKPYLIGWANRIGLEGYEVGKYRDEFAAIGKLVHYMIESHLRSETADLRDSTPRQAEVAAACFEKFLGWERSHKLETIMFERPLVSETHRFGGTPDWYGKVDGVLAIVDFKSSRGVYDDHLYQVAGGYVTLLEDNGHGIEQVRIVCVPRTREPVKEAVLPRESAEPYISIFRHALAIYEAKKRRAA